MSVRSVTARWWRLQCTAPGPAAPNGQTLHKNTKMQVKRAGDPTSGVTEDAETRCLFRRLSLCAGWVVSVSAVSVSPALRPQPAPGPGHPLSRRGRPAQTVCCHLLLPGCSWVILPNALRRRGSSVLPRWVCTPRAVPRRARGGQ